MTKEEALKIIWEAEFQEIIATMLGFMVAVSNAKDKYDCDYDDLPSPLLEFLVDAENATNDYLDSER